MLRLVFHQNSKMSITSHAKTRQDTPMASPQQGAFPAQRGADALFSRAQRADFMTDEIRVYRDPIAQPMRALSSRQELALAWYGRHPGPLAGADLTGGARPTL